MVGGREIRQTLCWARLCPPHPAELLLSEALRELPGRESTWVRQQPWFRESSLGCLGQELIRGKEKKQTIET